MSTGRRILYVEDDYLNFLLVERTLGTFPDIKVVHASTAARGLELARENPPQLILVDLHLPGMDGFDLTRTLKADASLKHIPVVALTANVMRGERERALEAGCVDFVPKPFNLRTFRQVVASHLGLVGGG